MQAFAHDEFLQLLKDGVAEAKVQKQYYQDLIDYLDFQSRIFWATGQKGVYPGFPDFKGGESDTLIFYPAYGIKMAQQSVLFWQITEFELDQFSRAYSKLPEGAYQTSIVQDILFDVIMELSTAALTAFNDIRANLGFLKDRYHRHLAESGLPANHLVSQKMLESTHARLEEILIILEKNEAKNIHWDLKHTPNLKRIFQHLPPSPLVDQFLKDFEENIRLLKSFLRFYQRDPKSIIELESGEKNKNRWARLIFFNFSLNFSGYDGVTNQRILSGYVEKDKILLDPVSVDALEKFMRTRVIQGILPLAKNKGEIETECAELRARDAGQLELRQKDPLGVRAELDGGTAASSAVKSGGESQQGCAAAIAGCGDFIEGGSRVGGAGAVGNDCSSSRASCSSLCQDSVSEVRSRLDGHGDGFHQAESKWTDEVCERKQGDSRYEDSLSCSVARSCSSSVDFARASVAGSASVLSSSEDEAVYLVEDEFDHYVAEILAEHRAHQMRKRKASDHSGLSLGAADASSHMSSEIDAASGGGTLGSATERVVLIGDLADSYRTVMGIKAPGKSSKNLNNKDVFDLIRALGGGVQSGKFADIRYVLPQFTPRGVLTEGEVVFKMHLRHSGREFYPPGTLNFFKSAIYRANLEKVITLGDE